MHLYPPCICLWVSSPEMQSGVQCSEHRGTVLSNLHSETHICSVTLDHTLSYFLIVKQLHSAFSLLFWKQALGCFEDCQVIPSHIPIQCFFRGFSYRFNANVTNATVDTISDSMNNTFLSSTISTAFSSVSQSAALYSNVTTSNSMSTVVGDL